MTNMYIIIHDISRSIVLHGDQGAFAQSLNHEMMSTNHGDWCRLQIMVASCKKLMACRPWNIVRPRKCPTLQPLSKEHADLPDAPNETRGYMTWQWNRSQMEDHCFVFTIHHSYNLLLSDMASILILNNRGYIKFSTHIIFVVRWLDSVVHLAYTSIAARIDGCHSCSWLPCLTGNRPDPYFLLVQWSSTTLYPQRCWLQSLFSAGVHMFLPHMCCIWHLNPCWSPCWWNYHFGGSNSPFFLELQWL